MFIFVWNVVRIMSSTATYDMLALLQPWGVPILSHGRQGMDVYALISGSAGYEGRFVFIAVCDVVSD